MATCKAIVGFSFATLIAFGAFDGTQARDLRLDRKLLEYRSFNGKSIAEILRSVRIGKPYKFEIQSVAEISPAEDGRGRVAICYWLGDVQHIEQEAICGIRFLFDAKENKWTADPGTKDLSDPLLSGETAFNLALDINFKAVCGTDPERSNRNC